MHLYWMIIEELKYIGEKWDINDPSVLRCYRKWIQKNKKSIELCNDQGLSHGSELFIYNGVIHSLN